MSSPPPPGRRALIALLLFYTAASFAHFTHNAERLAAYPNLPPTLTRAGVYAAFAALAGLGLAGYLLLRHGRARAGLLLLALYAACGFDGLLHYTRAPFAAHTATMNVTILTEVAAAALLLTGVLAALRRHFGTAPQPC
jgi:hypothetical protein